MTVHLVKLCVGAKSVEDLAAWQQQNRTRRFSKLRRNCAWHTTGQRPKREDSLLDGGSLYWVIKGVIQVRQRLLGFEAASKANGKPACCIILDPELVAVRPAPRRAFQGWRYLEAGDAPPDLKSGMEGDIQQMPPRLRQDLMELCLI